MISRGKVSDSLAIGNMRLLGNVRDVPLLSILAVGMVLHLYWKYE
jgi:hypothetical protein